MLHNPLGNRQRFTGKATLFWKTVLILTTAEHLSRYYKLSSVATCSFTTTPSQHNTCVSDNVVKTLTRRALRVSVLRHRSELGTKVMLVRHWGPLPRKTLGGL